MADTKRPPAHIRHLHWFRRAAYPITEEDSRNQKRSLKIPPPSRTRNSFANRLPSFPHPPSTRQAHEDSVTCYKTDDRLAALRAFTPCFATRSQIQSLWSSQQPVPKKRSNVSRQSQTCPDPNIPKEGIKKAIKERNGKKREVEKSQATRKEE